MDGQNNLEAPRVLTIERLGDGGFIVAAKSGLLLLATDRVEEALLYMANKIDPKFLHRDLNAMVTEFAKDM